VFHGYILKILTGKNTMANRIFKTSSVPAFIPRLITGLVFLSEGIQKFITPDTAGVGRFIKIGFAHPQFWALFTGSFEIVCGILLLLGFLTRLAAIPLLTIMFVAFITTKYPILIHSGFIAMAHEYRTDFAMTLLLLFLLYYGGGAMSVDRKYFSHRKY
jgi:putative oxidoreductase